MPLIVKIKNWSLEGKAPVNDIVYTLQVAPEVIGGFWFMGGRDILLTYRNKYMDEYWTGFNCS